MRAQGLFGPIEVVRTGRNQQLRINGQNQGGAYLAPPASVVDPSLPADAPGPASSSPYAVGWLISGVCHPSASGVMIGLGSGSGATQLLHEFPGIDLTILEIDPEVIRLATAAFPLLDYYADQGRLNIIEADAEDWLGAHTDGFQFALADAYTGEARLLDHYLEQLCRRAGSITLNVIDTLDGKSMTNVLRMLEEQGKPAQNVFRASHLGLGLNVEDGQPSNWIVTTCPTTPAELAVYAPFADVEGIGAYLTRLQWDQMLSLNVSGVGAVGRVMKAAALQQGSADKVDQPEPSGDLGDPSPTPAATNTVSRRPPRRIVEQWPNQMATETYSPGGEYAGLPLFNRAVRTLLKKDRAINPQQTYGPEVVFAAMDGAAYRLFDHKILIPDGSVAAHPLHRTPVAYAHELAHYHDPIYNPTAEGHEADYQAQLASGRGRHENELPAMVAENVTAMRHGNTDPYELADHAPARQGAWIYDHMLRYGPQIADARGGSDITPDDNAEIGRWMHSLRDTEGNSRLHRMYLHWLQTQRDAPEVLSVPAPAPDEPSLMSRIRRRVARAVGRTSVSDPLDNKIFLESARERAKQFLREERERAEARQSGTAKNAAVLQQGSADKVDQPEPSGDLGDPSPTPAATNTVSRRLPRLKVGRGLSRMVTDTYTGGTGWDRNMAELQLFNRAVHTLSKKDRAINPQQAYGPEVVRNWDTPAYSYRNHKIDIPREGDSLDPMNYTPAIYAHELAHYHDPVFDDNSAGVEMNEQAQLASGHDRYELELPAMVTENVTAMRHGHTDPYELAAHAPARQGAWIYNHMLRYGPQIADARERGGSDITPDDSAEIGRWMRSLRDTEGNSRLHRMYLHWLRTQRDAPEVLSRRTAPAPAPPSTNASALPWLRTQRDAPEVPRSRPAPASALPSIMRRIKRRVASAVGVADDTRLLDNKIFPESALERARQFLWEERRRAEARQSGTAK